MTFSVLTLVLIAAISAVCFTLGWTARRVSSSGREVELKRNVYEAKGAIPQLESTLRNRDQRITMLQTEAQSLRDRLNQVESAAAQKDTEIVKRDREIRLARSELQIVKDGSIGLEVDPDLLVESDTGSSAAAGSDPKLAAELKKLEARYESLKRGLIQRDDRIATLETEAQGGQGKASTRILEQELADQQAAAELAQATLAARDATIRDLQTRLEQDAEQRELLESLTKRRGDTNRTLKDNYTKLEAQLPKLTEALKARADVIAEREASIALLDADLTQVSAEKAAHEATIAALEAKLAAGADQISQQTANYLTQKQHLHEVEQRVSMLTHEVAETTKALQLSQALVRERDAALVARDTRAQSTDEKLREQGNTVASLQKTVKDRDFKIDGLVADMAAASAKLATAQEEAARQVAHSESLQRDLNKWEQRVGVLNSALTESDTAVQTKQTQAHEHDAALEGRDARLRDAQTQLHEHTNTIAALRKTLASRDSEVASLAAESATLRTKLTESVAHIQAGTSFKNDAASEQASAFDAPHTNAAGDATLQAIDAQLAAMTQRAERTERELNSTARELKTLRVQTAELETRCSSLDGLLRGKDASLTERARRIEDLQDQLQRLETRVDERNAQISELKRLRDEPPPSAYAAARNTAPAYTSHPKPQ